MCALMRTMIKCSAVPQRSNVVSAMGSSDSVSRVGYSTQVPIFEQLFILPFSPAEPVASSFDFLMLCFGQCPGVVDRARLFAVITLSKPVFDVFMKHRSLSVSGASFRF